MEKTYPSLTTNLYLPASNTVENKNRKAPGPQDSDRSSAPTYDSNPFDLVVLYFGTGPQSAAGENGIMGARIEEL
jgi:hypothetical protein